MKPIELISDVLSEHPDKTWLKQSLTNAVGEFVSKSYYRCVLDKDWMRKENYCIPFKSKKYGYIVLDIQPNNKIGGIEFVDLIEFTTSNITL